MKTVLKECLRSRVFEHGVILAAFMIPLAIRAIPEILVGPYPVGFDTIAFYAPNTLDWATGRVGLLKIIGSAPLIYAISVPTYLVSLINPIWIFKIMGPILYGSMSFALFRFLRLVPNWPKGRALGTVIFTSMYFVTLRIGWDLYRNVMGFTFLLLSIPILQELNSGRKVLASSLLLLLAVGSDQLTGLLAFSLVASRFLGSIRSRKPREVKFQLLVGVPALLLFFSIVFVGNIILGEGLIRYQPLVPTLSEFGDSAGFLGYAYLPLLPFVLYGFKKVRNLEFKVWSGICVLGVITGLLPVYGTIIDSYRWTLLLDIPVCVYAASGLIRLMEMAATISSVSPRTLSAIFRPIPILLILFSGLYIALPAQNPLPYYTLFPAFLPTSMIQNSVPQSDMGSLYNSLRWVAMEMGPRDAFIAHQAIYGWARIYLSSGIHIINYGFSDPFQGVLFAYSEGYSSVWLVWWAPGMGWYHQPYVPAGFAEVFQSGNIGVYRYQ